MTVQFDKVLCQWFVAIHSEEKPVTGPMTIEKAKSFYDKMKISDECTFSVDWLQNFKVCHGIRKLDVSG